MDSNDNLRGTQLSKYDDKYEEAKQEGDLD